MKRYKIFNKLLLMLFVIAGIYGCTTSDNPTGGGVQYVYHPAETKPQIIVYSKYVPVNLSEKQIYNINASIIPQEEESAALTYTSSDTSIASVTEDGSVSVNKSGVAVINIALEDNSSISNQVIINAYEKSAAAETDVPAMAVAVDKTYLQIDKGSGLAIFPSVRPGNAANKELGYLTTNASVANIDEKGLIQGISEGNAGIIIYSKSNPEKYAFISVDVTGEASSNVSNDFTAPAGVAPIDLNADPMSLIAKYKILSYSINGGELSAADAASNLRVNVDLGQLSAGIVKILMYVNLNGKEVRLIQEKNINDYGSIPDIFTSLGAKITGDYTMEFTLDPVNYTEFARQGMVNKGETLVLNIGKTEALTPAGGLGDDIEFDMATVPVEGENTDSVISNDFTAPEGVAPIDLNADPLSLIAKYKVLSYSINGGELLAADAASNLRVNVDLTQLSTGIVKILMYVNLNGKEVRLIQEENINEYGSIPEIFTSLGANITGDYTMEFTLDPVNYTEFAKQGMINPGETLVLNIGKIEALIPANGLGDDVEFDMSTVPVEEGNGTIIDTPAQDNSTVSGDNNTVTDDNTNSEENIETVIQVESIKLDVTEISPIKLNDTVQVNATVYPANAEDKTITWSSSTPAVATVDNNGLVTIHKNGKAVITATASNGVKAEMNVVPAETIDSYTLDSDKIELTMNVDAEAYLTYKVYPEILNGATLGAEYVSNNTNIVNVDNTGKVTAVGVGETYVKVTINNISKECYVVVNPEPENVTPVSEILLPNGTEGKYELSKGQFTLVTQVMPENAYNKRLKYQSSNTQVADVNAAGLVTFKGTGETTITITSSSNPEIQAVYKLIVETLPTRIVFESFDYGVAVGETSMINPIFEGNSSNTNATYSIDNTSVAKVDSKTGAVTGLTSGSATLKAVSDNGLVATTLITVYTPIKVGDVSTLQGTYQIVDFNQANDYLRVGTNLYGGVERMIGEMTVEVVGNTVKIKSKIQMDSSNMNNFGGVLGQGVDEARKGQFQYTEYADATYNASGFGVAGKGSAKVTHDNDKLKVYQQWSEIGVVVQVNTWIKKKSDTVKDLKKDYFHWTKNGANYDTPANAVAHHTNIKAPEVEPYYTFGLITK